MMGTVDDNNNDLQRGGSGEIMSNTKVNTSCAQNNIDTITKGVDSMAMAIQKYMTACAACGKVGNSDDMNTCNKCKEVRYCNAACKKKHRSKHKKKCDRRAAELFDEKLFKEVEPEECPICMLPIPHGANQISVESCCGKRICNGCIHAMMMSGGKDCVCAYCRMRPSSSDEDEIKE